MTHPVPDAAAPGQESVWDYPRPAIAQACAKALRILHRGVTVADTHRGVRTLETSHPPSYYFPPGDVTMALLHRTARHSFCEWKGAAVYYDVTVAGETFRDVAWSYPDPTADFAMLRDHIAFYAAPFDRCEVAGELVRPQPGGFYGGWVTDDLAGPFKGQPGTEWW